MTTIAFDKQLSLIIIKNSEYYNKKTCVELRKIISEWNKATPDERQRWKYLMPIKGIYKMKKEELVRIARFIDN